MEQVLSNGQEGNVKFNVIWKYSDNVYLTVENVETKQVFNHIHKCMYSPVFGIDVADYAELDKKLDTMIKQAS